MLTFLSPLLLVGVLSAAIPLIIHLSRSRRTRTLKFSTTMFFNDQFLKSYRMSRLKELWLLLCRMALCAVVAAAMARPLVLPRGGPLAGRTLGSRAVVLVVDNSASMGYNEDGTTLLERARTAAAGVVAGLRKGDAAALVLAGRKAGGPEAVFAQPTPDLGDVRQALDAVRVATLGTDLTGAIARAEAIARASTATSKEVYIFSDLQEGGWQAPEAADDAPGTPGDVALVFVGMRPKRPANLAVTAVQYAAARPMAGVPFSIRPHVVAQGDRAPSGDIRLVVDGREVGRRRVEAPKGSRWAVPRFEHTFDAGGWHTGYVEVDDPALPQDNRRYFALEVLDSVRVLAVDGAASRVPRLDELFFLKLALTAGGDARGAIRVDTVSPSALSGSDLGSYPLLILANVASLPAPQVEALEQYVDRGGSLLVFLGDQVDPAFYNPSLAAPSRLHGGLLPGRLLAREGDPQAGSEGTRVGVIDDAHPALSASRDPGSAGLADVAFKALWGLDPGPDSRVLMRAETGSPLLVEKPFGKGRVAVFTSTCDRDWTNFPVRPAFLPWIHRLVGYLAQEPMGRSAAAVTGDAIPLPASATEGSPRRLAIRTPGGGTRQATPRDGASGTLTFDETEEAGVYTLIDPSRPGAPAAFAVNLEGVESDLTYLDDRPVATAGGDRRAAVEAGLHALLPGRPALSYVDDPTKVAGLSSSGRQGLALWDVALWIALGIALLEPWAANRISLRHHARPRDVTRGGPPRGGRQPRSPASPDETTAPQEVAPRWT